jgi:uncharacterized membrane protein
MLEKIFLHIITEHRGKAIGVLLGLVASILFISYGFWRTVFIIACILAGYVIGKKVDQNANIESWIKDLFRSREQ